MEEGEERGAKGSRLLCSRTLKYAIGRLYTRVACHHTLSPASFNVVAHVEWKAKKKKKNFVNERYGYNFYSMLKKREDDL